MEIKKYEKDEHFERNEAVYILHKIDQKPFEEIAETFHLAVEEIQEIITIHARYEAAVMESY